MPIAKLFLYIHVCNLLLTRESGLMVCALSAGCSHLGSILCSKTRPFARMVSLSTPEYCHSHLQNTVGRWAEVTLRFVKCQSRLDPFFLHTACNNPCVKYIGVVQLQMNHTGELFFFFSFTEACHGALVSTERVLFLVYNSLFVIFLRWRSASAVKRAMEDKVCCIISTNKTLANEKI